MEQKNDIIRLYKKQLEDYRQIKKLVERAAWDDEKYYALIENLNIVGKSLAKALPTRRPARTRRRQAIPFRGGIRLQNS